MKGDYWSNRAKINAYSQSPGLDKLIGSANEVAGTARTLLTAMLVVAVTMTATMIAATDEALLRDSADVFPSLGVKVKLSTAYLLAPLIFVFLHANALLQLHLLRRRLEGVEHEMERQGLGGPERVRWRRVVHGFAFAQALLGSDSYRQEGWSEKMHYVLLVAMSWLAIAVVPVTLLVTAQVSFVRYQSDSITFAHQVTLSFDLALLGWFHWASWKRMTHDPRLAWAWSGICGLFVALLLWLSWTQAVPPSPDLDEDKVWWREYNDLTESRRFVPWLGQALIPALFGWQMPKDSWTLAPLNHRPNLLDRWHGTSWQWTRRYLDLSERTLIDNDAKSTLLEPFATNTKAKTAMQRQMTVLSLRGRTLRFADFSNTQLFAADLRDIKAEKSQWSEALLNGARFHSASLQGADLASASLQGADLDSASLQGADLDSASLQGANLDSAKLQGANLAAANLQGADLTAAKLQGANLNFAKLQGADLSVANLQGAALIDAWLDFATGPVVGCTSTLIQPTTSEQDSVEALLINLRKVGLSEEILSGILKRIESGPNARCGETPLDRLPEPSPEVFAKAQIEVACADAHAARQIIRHYLRRHNIIIYNITRHNITMYNLMRHNLIIHNLMRHHLPPPFSSALREAWDAAGPECAGVAAVKKRKPLAQ